MGSQNMLVNTLPNFLGPRLPLGMESKPGEHFLSLQCEGTGENPQTPSPLYLYIVKFSAGFDSIPYLDEEEEGL